MVCCVRMLRLTTLLNKSANNRRLDLGCSPNHSLTHFSDETRPVDDTFFFVQVGQRKHKLLGVARLMLDSEQTLLPVLGVTEMNIFTRSYFE